MATSALVHPSEDGGDLFDMHMKSERFGDHLTEHYTAHFIATSGGDCSDYEPSETHSLDGCHLLMSCNESGLIAEDCDYRHNEQGGLFSHFSDGKLETEHFFGNGMMTSQCPLLLSQCYSDQLFDREENSDNQESEDEESTDEVEGHDHSHDHSHSGEEGDDGDDDEDDNGEEETNIRSESPYMEALSHPDAHSMATSECENAKCNHSRDFDHFATPLTLDHVFCRPGNRCRFWCR